MNANDVEALDGLLVDPADLDERTVKELRADGLLPGVPLGFAKSPNPRCRWCKGTGRVRLLTSESDCGCVRMDLVRLTAPEKGDDLPDPDAMAW